MDAEKFLETDAESFLTKGKGTAEAFLEAPETKHTGGFLHEAVVGPAKTFYGGLLKAAGRSAGTIDFYADKIAGVIGIPETKNSVFEFLKNNWTFYGEKLQKEG